MRAGLTCAIKSVLKTRRVSEMLSVHRHLGIQTDKYVKVGNVGRTCSSEPRVEYEDKYSDVMLDDD
jgi:hypothetical protein